MSTIKRSALGTREERPLKRRATSSPEEGELDDSNSASPERPEPLASPTPADTNPKFKIPFPFKNKNKSSLLSRIEGPHRVLAEARSYGREQGREWGYDGQDRIRQRPLAVYERYEETDERLRDDYGFYRQDRRTSSRRNVAGDHYEPSYAAESRDLYYDHNRDREYDRRQVDRERFYSPPRKETPITASVSLQSSTRSPSPRSVSRGRSASRSVSPQGFERSKQRHRLPTPRSTSFAVSPVTDDYRHDRSVFRGDHYEPYSRETYRDRLHDPRGQYQRDELDDYDRYYRPGDPYSLDRGRRSLGYTRSPMYRPASPSRAWPELNSELPRSPPLPAPAQKDTNDTITGVNSEEALRAHEAIAFALRRPGAPRNERSSPLNVGIEKATPAPPSVLSSEQAAFEKTPVTACVKAKRVPIKRSREEEKLAYHRVFAGCGERDDYDVMTKLGEGTFGEVHKALHKYTGTVVALKRILMHNEKEGMPVTALREIKILKALKHPCIVDLLDMFVIQSKDSPMSVYMVFPYMDHDLAGLLENERVKLSPSQIKLYMKQILEGTEYMHHNNIVHRDMKAANLLISNDGSLKIADFGLARSFDPFVTRQGGHDRRYTNCVVTRWYRPPELLLGARQYGGEIDIWGIGCVLGEMIMRRPILPGDSDLDQLDRIWSLCGSPNQQNWPDYDKLPGCGGQIRFKPQERRVKQVYDSLGKETSELMDRLLTLDPRERINASDALDHEYFWSDPLPADPKSLPTYEASHEFDQRGRRRQAAVQNEVPKPPIQHGFPPPIHNRNYRNEDIRQQGFRASGPAPPYGLQNGFGDSLNGIPNPHLPLQYCFPPLPPHNPWMPGPAPNQPSFASNRPVRQGAKFGGARAVPNDGDRGMQRHQPSHLPPPPPGLPPRPGGLARPLGKPPMVAQSRTLGKRSIAPPSDSGGLNYG